MENEINHEKMPLSMGQIRPDILVLAEGFGQSALGYVSRVPEDSLASQDDSLVLSPAYVLEPLGQAPVKIIPWQSIYDGDAAFFALGQAA